MTNDFEKILEETKEIGYVALTAYPLMYVKGLPSVKMSEVVQFVYDPIRPSPKREVFVHDTIGVRIRTVVVKAIFIVPSLGEINFFDRFRKY